MFFIPSAFAESAEAASESGLDLLSGRFSILKIVLILLGAYYFITGLLTVFTGKLYGTGSKEYAKYTEESVKRNIKRIGLSNALLGLFLIVAELAWMEVIPLIPAIVAGGVIVAVTVILGILITKKLVKKTAA